MVLWGRFSSACVGAVRAAAACPASTVTEGSWCALTGFTTVAVSVAEGRESEGRCGRKTTAATAAAMAATPARAIHKPRRPFITTGAAKVPSPAGASELAARAAPGADVADRAALDVGAAAGGTVGPVAVLIDADAARWPVAVISGRPVSASMKAAISAKRSPAFLARARSTAARILGFVDGTMCASEGWSSNTTR